MDIRILGWEGYDDPVLLDPFSEASGLAVQVDTHISDFEAAESVLNASGAWDIVNINSPFIRDGLYPRGKIRTLVSEHLRAAVQGGSLPASFAEMQQWCLTPAGEPIGIGQRFGPFNFVVNTDAISRAEAEEQGFGLAAGRSNAGRYGILAYDDFNVMHIAIAAGLNPFHPMGEADFSAFGAVAAGWFAGAKLITSDFTHLNRALVARDIDFYLGGGVYTASSARFEGHNQIRAITPKRGPIEGRGGVSFVEVNAVVANATPREDAERFLEYLLLPGSAVRACLAGGSANPVLQMNDPRVFSEISTAALNAMQWETLEEDLNRCAQYRMVPDYLRLREILHMKRSRELARRGGQS